MVIARLLTNLTGETGTFEQVQTIVILLVVTLIVALASRRLRLPYTLLLVLVGFVFGFLPILTQVHLDPNVVLFLFLPALLFEGAWNIEVAQLVADWLPVVLLAIPGLALSLVLVAAVVHWGIGLPWLLTLLLGAMVSPTDPIAVLSLLRQLGMADRLRTIVEGESLFNDGVGAAAYGLVLGLLVPSLVLTAAASETSFHLIEITVTFSVAYGVYLLGTALHSSGLLAVVGAGLVMGSYGRRTGMSERTQEAVDAVWEFTGYLANSLLFLLLGIQISKSIFTQPFPGILWALLGVVVGRALMVYTLLPLHDFVARRLARRTRKPRRFLPFPRPIPSSWRPLLVLSGLRGALSIALVLSLPATLPQRNLLAEIVYGVVLVTLLGQGIGLRILLPRWPKEEVSSADE